MRRPGFHTALVLIWVMAIAPTTSAQGFDHGAVVLVRDLVYHLHATVIVARPGDTVTITRGQLAINGAPTDLVLNGRPTWGPRVLAPSEYFAAGDPLKADDETAWGVVLDRDIVGTAQPRR